ncbi:hypothetical protein C0T31_11665 [Dysgonamonadaceae bacterium]|nr:hypothetical protein C0T31_11665 [Dysgonamonadaceae bacterium]
MLPDKDIIKLSEINKFFTSREKAIETIFRFIRSLRFSDKKHGFAQSDNLKYSNRSKSAL